MGRETLVESKTFRFSVPTGTLNKLQAYKKIAESLQDKKLDRQMKSQENPEF